MRKPAVTHSIHVYDRCERFRSLVLIWELGYTTLPLLTSIRRQPV